MLMSRVLAALVFVAVLFGLLLGRMDLVALAAIDGAKDAVMLLLSIGGTICLWSGLMEVMARSGLAAKLSRLLMPVIRLLFGKYACDQQVADALSQNMAANLLGLGSAATPSGLRAAERLNRLSHQYGERPHAVFKLIVLNTASIQLLPTTIAAVRAAEGSSAPYDILFPVWLASAVSVAVGLLAAGFLRKFWKKHE